MKITFDHIDHTTIDILVDGEKRGKIIAVRPAGQGVTAFHAVTYDEDGEVDLDDTYEVKGGDSPHAVLMRVKIDAAGCLG